ncbi:MAG: DUF4157 domain-containing protein [Candidatus Solibacter sp.]|nr:DUF4157 domain-containing protein [Candidatus Solibacter sp.]
MRGSRLLLLQSRQPLDPVTRAIFHTRSGQGFSGVRIHTGRDADGSAEGGSALAYTLGSHVVFRDGEFAPASEKGWRLLAHELAHVIQQRHATGKRTSDWRRRCPR